MITKNGGWDFWVLRYQTQSAHGSQDTIKGSAAGLPGRTENARLRMWSK